jgi:hypothetical protein
MDIDEAVAEIQQTRSRYQIIRFVLGQHDTPEMQFYQLCLELNNMRHTMRRTVNTVKQQKVKIKRLLAEGDELSDLEAEELQIGLDQTMLVMKGAEREIEILEDLFHSCTHFTRDEIEHAQPEYWEKRLTRQTNLQIMAGNVGWAQLDSMRQIGLLDELVEERQAQIETNATMELA